MERFDLFGGVLETDTSANGKVVLVICEGRSSTPQAHVLDRDDAVALAHDLLRKAFTLGDKRTPVYQAYYALTQLADREEHERLVGEAMGGTS